MKNPTSYQQKWQKALENRKSEGLYRSLKTTSNLIDFSSNDYLGLARNEELHEIVANAYNAISYRNKLGSTGSRLISGNHTYFEETEALLANTHLAESALLFNTGYMANLAVFSTLPKKGDTILYDELCHACIKDGIRLGLAHRFPFLHNDLESLESKLKKTSGQTYVAVESVYSMHGDVAPLAEMADLCTRYNAILVVDEAHSTGVYGQKGAGIVCDLGLEEKIPIRIHTFGKAIGAHGAAVVGSKTLSEYLVNFARPFIYTTAMSLHSVVNICEAYHYLANHAELQENITNKIQLFKSLMKGHNVLCNSDTPIQAILAAGNDEAKAKANLLQENGFDIRPILSPTVKKGSERLRVCLHVHNSIQDLENLAKIIRRF
jgi:8-amino-7-oxononanoate synthase